MAWTTPRTWVADEVVTATVMNTHVRDNFKAIGDAWTGYTPTVVQSGTVTTVTVTRAKYISVGKLVIGVVKISFTGATGAVGNNPITVSLPVTAATSAISVGSGWYFDTGSAQYPAVVHLASTSTLALYRADSTLSAVYPIGQDPNITVANGDVLVANFTYEAA